MSELIFLTKSISASSDNLEISTVRITSAGEFFPSDLVFEQDLSWHVKR